MPGIFSRFGLAITGQGDLCSGIHAHLTVILGAHFHWHRYAHHSRAGGAARNDKNEASELGKYLNDSPPSQVGKTGVFPREYQSANSDGFVGNNTTKQKLIPAQSRDKS